MTVVFREIEIAWDGQTFTVTPDMRIVRAIEGEVSILGVLARAENGAPPISHIAFIVSKLLFSAGADEAVAKEDRIYQRLYDDPKLLAEAIAILMVALGVDPGAAREKAAAGNVEAPASQSGQST